jgi:hypothetical protein
MWPFVWVAGAIASACCVGCGGANRCPIFADGSLPWVLVECQSLVHNGLQCGGREGVVAEAEILDYPVIAREEESQHKTNLEHRVDCNAPHFEGCKEAGESSLGSDDGFVLGLFDVDEIKNVTK